LGPSVIIGADIENSPITAYEIHVFFAERDRFAVVETELIRKRGAQIELRHDAEDVKEAAATYVKRQTDVPARADVQRDELRLVRDLLGGVQYYRWDPRSLALPVALDTKRSFRMETNGFGLALCLDNILGDNPDQFIQLQRRLTDIFPHITSMKLSPEGAYRAGIDDPDRVTMLQEADGKGLYFKLRVGDQWVPASQVSDGVLLVLAYLAILYLPEDKRPRVLLVEEPENGIHPKRLRDVLTILRELVGEQSYTQVVLTTHSPYALDLFKPEEVTLCTMQDNGEVKTTRLADSPTVMNQTDVFTLGEIWTAEGDDAIAQARETTGEGAQ
jgi:predicted ATPase